MIMSGSASFKSNQKAALFALMLWKLIARTRKDDLVSCFEVLGFVFAGEEVCCGDPMELSRELKLWPVIGLSGLPFELYDRMLYELSVSMDVATE